MNEEATRQNADFTIAILPGSSYINSPDSYSYYFQEHIRKSVLFMAEKLGIDTIDIASALKAHSDKALYFPNERHLTFEGNNIVSDILLESLNSGRNM